LTTLQSQKKRVDRGKTAHHFAAKAPFALRPCLCPRHDLLLAQKVEPPEGMLRVKSLTKAAVFVAILSTRIGWSLLAI
jgi:hypothetical protein